MCPLRTSRPSPEPSTALTDDSFLTESPFDADVFDPEPTPLTEQSVADIATLLPYVESSNPRSIAVVTPPPPGEQSTIEGYRPQPPDNEKPRALFYPSQEGGTGIGHVVIVQANNELACICWPGLRLRAARGCHAMVAARKLLGMPEVE